MSAVRPAVLAALALAALTACGAPAAADGASGGARVLPGASAPAARPTTPASGTQAQGAGPNRLVLTVADGSARRTMVLSCDPAGGAHPHAAQACDQLARSDGSPAGGVPTRMLCPMIYAPVTASAVGTWHGRPVSWSRQYANSCELDQHTGAVFQF